MASVADIISTPGVVRPETAGGGADASAAGETSFAEILDAEVQTTTDAETSGDAATAAAIAAPQAQPAAPAVTSTVESLISLQSADTTTTQPADTTTEQPAGDTAEAAPAVVPAVTAEPELGTAESAPASSVPAPTASAPATDTAQPVAQPPLPQTPIEMAAAAPAATAAVAAPIAKPSQPAAKTEKEETASEGDAAPTQTSGKAVVADAALQPTTAVEIFTAPQTAAAPANSDPTETAVIAPPASKQAATAAPQQTSEASANVPPAAMPGTEVPDGSTQGPETAAPGAKAASSPATASPAAGGAKSQANVQAAAQATAADAATGAKPAAPLPTSTDSATALADLLAAGRGTADVAKAAPAHQAMQSAPAAVVQVYTRFMERFDGRAQRFEVSLTPAELGRVDVRIEIGADKKVHAVLAAHDSAALTDLMRGQRALERALMDAGIDLKDGGVKFELANDSNRSLAGQEQRRDAWTGEERNVWRGFSTADVAVETDVPVTVNSYRRASRFDLVA